VSICWPITWEKCKDSLYAVGEWLIEGQIWRDLLIAGTALVACLTINHSGNFFIDALGFKIHTALSVIFVIIFVFGAVTAIMKTCGD